MLRPARFRHWLWLVLPLLASAWTRDLWAPDEPRYAEVARELHATGDYLVLHLCGEVYPDKPPLLFWLAGLLGWLSWFPSGFFAVAGAVLLCGGPLANMLGSERLGELDPAAIGWRSLPAGVGFSITAFTSVHALRRRAVASWAWSILLGWSGAITAVAVFLYPLVDELKSARTPAEWLAARPERPTAIPCLAVQPEGYRFYGGVPTVRDFDLAAALDREGEHFLALANELDYESLPRELRERTSVLHRSRVGSREVLVLGAADRAR